MMLILTHENSDFDAVASQFAAHKLYPEGIPLLSWRVNRNVLQYLNLYWDAFGFVRPDDWKRRRVNRVLLVDTMALPSVRGLRQDKVEVQVIDHHELEDDRDLTWIYHVDNVGATTTILVEMLQDAGLNLGVNEATLLLLGIHEDTGSLVYDTTTPRDAQAASWLLQQGAQLSVLRRFLNIPLSKEQQKLYDRLHDAVKWVTIEGQTIAIASTKAPEGFEDEISAVAHRLRDTLTPDGLILLVQLKYDHIQLVCRSSTNHFDVAVIARALGGGGHSRAAAATIMDQELDYVHQQVMDQLREAVRPMAKVAQIMSYGVQTLPETASVAEAAELMRKFGHEGYPVIETSSGNLSGLVTRRIVDRAIGHQLEDLEVRQVMKAGRVVVHPSDSVERVQRLMSQEGWGQIPVVADPEDGDTDNIIGIVTRTDLINLLAENGDKTRPTNLRDLMSESLPRALWDMVLTISEAAKEMDMPLYFVGGLVRDLLLDNKPTDIDMVVEGDAIKLVRRLQKLHGGESRSHAQFGTAKWLVGPSIWRKLSKENINGELPNEIDFVTARTEFYTMPSALPEVERGSIKLDLHRRDFTINTLAVRLDGHHLGELLDFYNGRRDLELGLIRVLHSLSFVDDPTRILRAVRLEQRLGFQIESRTAELIEDALPMLNRVSGDRIRNELELCFLEDDPVAIFERLAEFGALAQIHPALTWRHQTAEMFSRVPGVISHPLWEDVAQGSTPAFIYFALLVLPLSQVVQQDVMSRLKVRKSTVDDIAACAELVTGLKDLPHAAKPSQIARVLSLHRDRVLLVARIIFDADSINRTRLDRHRAEWRHVKTALKGNDLIEMGIAPGPEMGHLLERLQAARLDKEIVDEAGERLLVAKILSGES